MSIASTIDYTVKFNLEDVAAKFNFTDDTDYSAEGISLSNVKGNFSIVDPAGTTVYENTSWVSPDITGNVSLQFNSVTIARQSNGYPMTGQWTFVYTVKIGGGVQPGTYTNEKAFDYDYTGISVLVQLVSNAFTELLKSTDNTNYTWSSITPTISRTHTVTFPSASSHAPITSANAYIGIAYPDYIQGVWQSAVESVLLFTFDDGLIVSDTVSGTAELNAESPINMQDVFCTVDKAQRRMLNAEGTDIYQSLRESFELASSYLSLANTAVNFAQYTKAAGYIEQIYAVTDSTPGCNCGTNTFTRSIVTCDCPTSNNGTESEWEIGDFKNTARTVVGGNWEFSIGQIVLIADYQELYDVIGTKFNFGSIPSGYFRFPDTRGRMFIGAGAGVGLTNRNLGSFYGAESYNATHDHGITDIIIDDHDPLGTLTLEMDPLSGTLSATGAVTIAVALGDVTPVGTITMDSYTPAGSIVVGTITPAGSITVVGITMAAPAFISGTGTFTASNSYIPTGNIAITGITMAAPAFVSGTGTFTATNSYTPTGNVSTVNFSNTTISGTISEAVPGHHHDVTVPAMVPQYGDTPTNIPAAPGTYTTTDTIVSINLALQLITFGGTQVPTFTATNSYTPTGNVAITGITMAAPAFVSGTGTFAASNSYTPTGNIAITGITMAAPAFVSGSATFAGSGVTPTATFTGTPHVLTGTFTGDTHDFTHNHNGTITIDPIDVSGITPSGIVTIPAISPHIITGSTDSTIIIVPTISPALGVNVAIKVA